MKQKILSSFFITILFLCLNAQVATAQVLTLPVHFVDSQAIGLLDSTNGYQSIELDITPEVAEGTDGYYFANTVYFNHYTGTNFGGAYAGFQTNGYNGTNYIGKMALFSVWDASSGIVENGGWGTGFGGEGSGYSTRIAYNWIVNHTYKIVIYLNKADAGSGNSLWGATITDTSINEKTQIGRIYVPISRGNIYGPVSFHERYSGSTSSCSAINRSQVLFSNATANSGSILATSFNHYVVASSNDCPNLTWLQDISGGYRSGVGTQKPNPSPEPVTPAIVTPKPVAPQPAPVTVPDQKVPTIPFVPTTTKTVVPVAQPKIIQRETTTKSKMFYIILFTVLMFMISFGAILSRQFIARKNSNKYLEKHFPHDFDIHGPLS
jgi:hypothetical protein